MEDIEKLKSQIENLEKQINVFNEEYNKKLKAKVKILLHLIMHL